MSAASVRLSVDGMTCLHCVGTVQKALEGVGGVRRAEVDLASGVARVDADADAPLSALVAAVEAVGFGAAAASPETATTTLAVRGMTCARCEAWVADALRAVPGVAKVAVSVADGAARVEAASVSRARRSRTPCAARATRAARTRIRRRSRPSRRRSCRRRPRRPRRPPRPTPSRCAWPSTA